MCAAKFFLDLSVQLAKTRLRTTVTGDVSRVPESVGRQIGSTIQLKSLRPS